MAPPAPAPPERSLFRKSHLLLLNPQGLGAAGAMPTHGMQFVGPLIATIVVIGGLTFLPALALGPVDAGKAAAHELDGRPVWDQAKRVHEIILWTRVGRR